MSAQKLRPRWHYTAANTWLNDPNGLIWLDGTWHLFYQSNPFDAVAADISWGHATSSDLLTWTEQPLAISQNSAEEIFSGSCVFDAENTSGLGSAESPPLVACYTANYRGDSPRQGMQAQCLAYSLDHGHSWLTYPGNPVLERNSANFRDPKVFWHLDAWVMVSVEAEAQQVLIHRSPDLINWQLASTFGPLHAAGGAWECPDLIRVPVDGTDEFRWVLLVNVFPGGVAGGSGCQYFVGDFDGHTFVADRDAGVHADRSARADLGLRRYDWLDFGRDCYAVVTFSNVPDNRVIALGWMNNWEYAIDVPRTGGRGAMTIPRELSLVKQQGRYLLRQSPVRELDPSALINHQLGDGETLTIGGAVLAYSDGVLSLDRRSAGATGFHPAFPSREWADIPGRPTILDLDILLDSCSIEIFAAGGLITITDLVFFDDV